MILPIKIVLWHFCYSPPPSPLKCQYYLNCIIYFTFLLQTLFHAKDGAPANLHLLHDFRNGCVGEQSCHDLFSLGLHAGEQVWDFWQKKIFENFFFVIVFSFMPVSWILKKIGNFHSLFWNLIVDVKVSHNSYWNHNRNLDNQDTDRKEDR